MLLTQLTTGCVQSAYHLTAKEAERIAALPPEERGQRIRAVQGTLFSLDPAVAPPENSRNTPPAALVLHLNEIESRLLLGYALEHGSSTSSSGSSSGGDLGALEAAGVLFVAAGIATSAVVAVAIAEGSRHDGWITIPSDAPLLQVSPDGARTWLTLDQLSREQARQGDFYVYDWHDSVRSLESAPLDRVGFAYSVQMGTAGLNSTRGSLFPGFGWRAALGYFPWQTLGFSGGLQFAHGSSSSSSDASRITLTSYRFFVQAESTPLALGPFHLGLYAEAGLGTSLEDPLAGPPLRASGLSWGGGGALELELTTRVSANLKGGGVWMPSLESRGSFTFIPEILLGITVY